MTADADAAAIGRLVLDLRMQRLLWQLERMAQEESGQPREMKALPLDVTALGAGEFVGLAAVYDAGSARRFNRARRVCLIAR